LVLPNGYRERPSGYVFWFLDADGDGRCSAAAGDQFGYRSLDGLDSAGVTGDSASRAGEICTIVQGCTQQSP